MEKLLQLEQLILNLSEDNLSSTVQQTTQLFESNIPYSFNLLVSNLLYFVFFSRKKEIDIYLELFKKIQMQEKEINKSSPEITEIFIENISGIRSCEAYYLIEQMIKRNYVDKSITESIQSKYFAHYKTEKENKKSYNDLFEDYFFDNYDKLSQNDFKLHKKFIEEGHNPNEIAKIIRDDEIEKLQEISSQSNFDFNQTIAPSLYERCSFINQNNVTLIYYAAFFGSVKCFKYLLLNGAKVNNTGKYAIAGGNEEIIHLCEQNHSSFKDAYEAAIEFHRNDIFKYIYENKLEKTYNLEELGEKCIIYYNFDVFSFLIDEGMKINDDIINASVRTGNIFIVKYLHQNNRFSKDILKYSVDSKNNELIKYILEQGIDINIKNNSGKTALIYASEKNYTKTVKFLLEQEGIDVNIKDNSEKTALMKATDESKAEIVKLLLEHEEIDINVKNKWEKTPLAIASWNNNPIIVKLLLEHKGIDLNAKNIWGNTALMNASQCNYIDIAQLLIEKEGIDINAKNNYGQTALMYASENGYVEIVKLLLEQKGIDINAKNNNGDTALIIASSFGKIEIVKLLLEQEGIDINVNDDNGNTGLKYASSNGYKEIVKLLRKHEKIDNNDKCNNR